MVSRALDEVVRAGNKQSIREGRLRGEGWKELTKADVRTRRLLRPAGDIEIVRGAAVFPLLRASS
ncbi:hypothetical protein [Bradyrhizobium australafricanum]|uniref:hypothetical protein n=1 Tax=Bradyrhizobium australafricanum TaxID=2821406 RepID=UPI001CE3780D|nr:hypothetical protein [Bradyrhizobium australafricanum]MCA6100060.1 hypothetical protein [Bradyrhizobium australafricanum]